MSYLLDKKTKREKNLKIASGIVLLCLLFYFRAGIFHGLAYLGQGIFRPVVVAGEKIGEKLNGAKAFFLFKSSLLEQNQNLQMSLSEKEAQMANYLSLQAENEQLKEILGRKKNKVNLLLAGILAKPNQSAYDTLLLDVGAEQGIQEGDLIFASGDVPLGKIVSVYPDLSKALLFSSPGERTSVILPGNIFLELVGRGGGNFEMAIPRDLPLQKGDQAILPGIHAYTLAIVQTTISDPRDLFTKALLTSPVNVQSLKFVQVEI